MTTDLRFFSLLLLSGAVHIALFSCIDWTQPQVRSGASLQVSMASVEPPSPWPVAGTPSPVAELEKRSQQMGSQPAETRALIATTESQRVVTTTAVAAGRVIPAAVSQAQLRGAVPVQPLSHTSTVKVDEAEGGALSQWLANSAPAPAQNAKEVSRGSIQDAAALSPFPGEAPPDVASSGAVSALIAANLPGLDSNAEANQGPRSLSRSRSGAVDSASIGRQLLTSLQDHFSYPLRARRKGWEGDVLLGVDLDEAGVIAEVRLLASSGYATLDQAAMASMRAVGVLEQHLSGRLTVEVPVRYRLIN